MAPRMAPLRPRVRVKAGDATGASAVRLDAGTTVVGDVIPSWPLGGPLANPHQGSSLGRRMAAFRPIGSGPNAVVSLSQPEMLRRSRDMRRNNPMGKRALDLYVGHIVGSGIKPRSQCPNDRIRQQISDLWEAWVPDADADGLLDFYGLQALATSEMCEGGETFARLRARRLNDPLAVPLQVQLLPAEQVPLEWSVPFSGNSVLQGIERDAIGGRVAYWIYPRHPFEIPPNGAGVGLDNQPVRVLAGDVAHLFNVARIGQMRGLPWLAAAITTLHQINAYTDAELLRKQMVAAIVGFVETGTPEDATPADVAARFGPVDTSAASDIPAAAMEPGTIQYLQPGEKVSFNTPADVGGNFETFVAASDRGVAAAANQLYEELTGDWKNTNDRTFRAQFNTFKRMARAWQFSLVCAQFNQPVWNRFLDYALSSGRLAPPKSVSDADLRAVTWHPERWEYIQPVQDIEASGLEIGLGLTSRAAAAAERGDDVELIDQQIAADQAREKSLGLAFGAGLAKATLNPNLAGVDQAGAATPSSAGAGAPAQPAGDAQGGGDGQQQDSNA